MSRSTLLGAGLLRDPPSACQALQQLVDLVSPPASPLLFLLLLLLQTQLLQLMPKHTQKHPPEASQVFGLVPLHLLQRGGLALTLLLRPGHTGSQEGSGRSFTLRFSSLVILRRSQAPRLMRTRVSYSSASFTSRSSCESVVKLGE
ncbi:hypothetical protein EYF80_038190 [Liparis tanakae]|uniref:Uncharacterized protein n=1 Tax=Liparis tanakae TaxID=230148 RepID=A0A4Z2GFV6_9TELE|nr:hypothetical protein EYF80_038190 [Liparis tanakae]